MSACSRDRYCSARRLALAVLLSCSGAAAAAADRIVVPAGQQVTRIHRGEPLVFELELPPGDWLIEARERHTDVRWLVTPSGADTPQSFNGPIGGADSILWVDSAGVSRRVTVRAETATVVNREGELTLGTAPIPFPTGRVIRDAAAAEMRMASLAGSDDFADRERALAAATEAASLWRRVGEPERAAEATLAAASIAFSLDRFDAAKNLASDAQDAFRQLESDDGAGFALNLVGLIAIYQRDFDQADAVLTRAETLLGDRYAAAGVNPAASNRCFADLRRRRLDRAEACYQRLQALAAERGALSDESLYLNNLGGINAMRGEPARAIGFLERAEALARGLGDERSAARRAVNIGTQYRLLGDTQRALNNYQRGLAYFRRIGDDRQTARVLNNIGLAYLRLGEPNRSLPFLQESHAFRQRIDDVQVQIVTMNSLGSTHMALGDATTARDWHERALKLARNSRDDDGVAQSLVGLSRAELALGNAAESIRIAREVTAMLAGTARKVLHGTALHLLGVSLLTGGQPEAASKALRQALSLRLETGYEAGQAETLTAIAAANAALGRSGEALDTAVRAIDMIERLRTDVASPDLRASFQSSVAQAYEIAIEMQMGLPDAEARHAALTTAERYRARALVDVLARGTVPALDALPRDLVETRDRLRGEINRRSLRQLNGAANDGDIVALLAELDVVEAQIAAGDPRFRTLTRRAPPTPADMQALLDENTVVLQYFLGARRSYGWIISHRSIDSFELPPEGALTDLTREAHLALSRRGRDRAQLSELGDLLLRPAAAATAGFRRVAIIADGPLHFLPFAALDADARHGIRDKTLIYVPSFTTLELLRETGDRAPAGKQLAILADPVFSARDPRLGMVATPRPVSTRAPIDPEALNRLSMTATEAEIIAGLLPEDAVSVRTGFEATPAALRHPDVRDARRIHIATHGIVDSRFPAMSGLALSMRSADGREVAGFVGMRDIYGLRFAADLVVLSACETAIGREMRGEGLLGLTRGFLFAGAKRVVASLWQVEDRVTAEFMRAFYTALLSDGLPPAEALARAQAEIRANRRWRHPYYWSAFTIQGDWR